MGSTMIETDVAIVGAGGGGAVLALMLAQQGVRSLVLERAQDHHRDCEVKCCSRTASGCWIVLGSWINCRSKPPERSGDSIFAARAANGFARLTMAICRLRTIAPW